MAKAKGVEAHIGDCGANCDSSEKSLFASGTKARPDPRK
jgi:hypothetical protein